MVTLQSRVLGELGQLAIRSHFVTHAWANAGRQTSLPVGLCCILRQHGVQQPRDQRKLVPPCRNSLNTELWLQYQKTAPSLRSVLSFAESCARRVIDCFLISDKDRYLFCICIHMKVRLNCESPEHEAHVKWCKVKGDYVHGPKRKISGVIQEPLNVTSLSSG